MSRNVTPHDSLVTREDRRRAFGHGSCVLWLTGLSGSGKSTIAAGVEKALCDRGVHVYALDGDTVRQGLNRDLEFTEEDRMENIRRLGEVCRLFVDAGIITVTAFISPFIRDRDRVRSLLAPGEFFEIYTRCPLDICEKRDPKGLYVRARAGEIQDFTGITSPYEEPVNPELVLDTGDLGVEECVAQVLALLQESGIIGAGKPEDAVALRHGETE